MDPRKRLVRKEILRSLKYAGDYGTTAEVIAATLEGCGHRVTVPEIEQHMQYLAGPGKDFIRVLDLAVEGMGRRLVANLLPKGVDLLDGNIPSDPGVA